MCVTSSDESSFRIFLQSQIRRVTWVNLTRLVACHVCAWSFLYLYEGRLARISLVFWAVTPLSDESCESSLSEPRALKEMIRLTKCIWTIIYNGILTIFKKKLWRWFKERINDYGAKKTRWSHLYSLPLRGLNDRRLCRLDHSLNLKLTPRQLYNSHRTTTQWHLQKHKHNF